VGFAALLVSSLAAGLALSTPPQYRVRTYLPVMMAALISSIALATINWRLAMLVLLGSLNGTFNGLAGHAIVKHGVNGGDPAAAAYASHITRNVGGFFGALLFSLMH
jgi:hypothetical protein